MVISCAKCRSILDTLPIGYYAGRRIQIEMDEKADTSFYSPMEDKIIVSYPIIAERLAHVENCDEEEAVRSMLYHEVSHAILTPAKDLYCTPQMNIFEDERIETVLKDYYLGVNFKKQLYDLHGGTAPKAMDATQAFFNAVRFGLGTYKVQNEVQRILQEYSSLNRNSDRYYTEPNCYDYEKEVNNLYELVKREFRMDSKAFNQSKARGTSQQMDSIKNNSSSKDNPNNKSGTNNQGDDSNQNKSNKTDGNTSKEESEGDVGAEQSPSDIQSDSFPEHRVNMSADELKKLVSDSVARGVHLSEAQAEKLNEFQKVAETIIGNFNKKNSGGSGINTYSGVFNPRAVARKDYRFFERSMSVNGNNKYGTCHLNLLIDCSGSFCNNQNLVNGIIATLSDIERKNKNFSLDVAFINDRLHLCKTVRERAMRATGGNRIPAETKEVLRKLQKSQTCNYNIILFDGDALSDVCCDKREGAKLFSIFDMKQTTLITDPENERYMPHPFTSSKVVITQNYTAELIDHIIRALTIAFG